MEKEAPQNRTFVTLVKAKATTRDGERWIEGYATTPEVDRMGDVVEPLGAKYALPIPLLWQHKHDTPIGAVTEAHVTARGIRIKARLSAGLAKADEIWQLISDGVLTAVSIGFRALDSEPLKGGGLRFRSWEWLELSVVSVPAQAGAKITVAKMMAHPIADLDQRSAPAVIADGDGWKAKAKQTTGRLLELARKDVESIPSADRQKIRKVEAQAYAMALRISHRLVEEVDRLERRIGQLEATGIKYCGTWQRAMDYDRGAVVTHGGSAWVALKDAAGEPGNGDGWQLMVKRGRDA